MKSKLSEFKCFILSSSFVLPVSHFFIHHFRVHIKAILVLAHFFSRISYVFLCSSFLFFLSLLEVYFLCFQSWVWNYSLCAFMQKRWEDVCYGHNEVNSAVLWAEDGRGTQLLIILMTALSGVCYCKGWYSHSSRAWSCESHKGTSPFILSSLPLY